MTQHTTMTTPISDAGDPLPTPSTATEAIEQRPRRRLGGWQAAVADAASAAFGDPISADGSTGAPHADGPATADTSAFGAAPAAGSPTAPFAAVIGTAATTDALVGPSMGAATERLAAAARAIPAAFPRSGIAGSTEDLTAGATIALQRSQVGSASPTRPLDRPHAMEPATVAAAPTAALPSAQAPAASAQTRTLPAEEAERLATLRELVAANPSDSDALFELAVALHRAGHRAEAREALTRLGALYQARGQHSQAARIRGLLGAPKTGPVATEDLPPRPAAPATTAQLGGRTTPLHAPTGPIGRAAREQAVQPAPPPPAFPPESLEFTIPLPGESRLSAEVRQMVDQSTEDLRSAKLHAAYDSCLFALSVAPEFAPLHLRIAEIYTAQRLTRRARIQGETLLRLAEASGDREHLWMIYRVLLHTSDNDLPSLRRLVELLVDAGQTKQASFYASMLVQLLDAEGLSDEALAYSIRLCNLIPGDTRAALENAILRLKNGDRGGAVDRWETAVAAGADQVIATASMAAVVTGINEDDHWRMLGEVIPVLREHRDRSIVDAYVRTAAMEPTSATLVAGQGLLLAAVDDPRAREFLATAAGDRAGSAMARASSAVALAWLLRDTGHAEEYVAAERTAIKLLEDQSLASNLAWQGLVGRIPRFEDLSLELGEALLARQDASGAVQVLKAAHERSRHHGPICDRLAEAYFRVGQLGSALTILDELAVHHRAAGQLAAMADVLRQMSQLAPNNIKVKARLIDAYLQRGFVAEARAELVQRADLEERSGLIKDAVASLQRAADLSWTVGLADETFALYNRVIALTPNDVGHRHALVNHYLQMGRLSDAAEHQRAVVDLSLTQDHKHEAIAALHQVIGLTPDDTSAYYQLGDLLSSIGEYHQAEKVYRRLVIMNPSDAIAQAKVTTMASLRDGHAS